MNKVSLVFIALLFVLKVHAQDLTLQELLEKSSSAMGLQTLDSLKTLQYELLIASGGLKQEFHVVAKGKRRISASSNNLQNPVTFVRNGSAYFLKKDSVLSELTSENAIKNLNNQNFFRGLSNILDLGAEAELVGAKKVSGNQYYHIKSTRGNVTEHLLIDENSFLPFRERRVKQNSNGDIEALEIRTFKEYQSVEGVLVPTQINLKQQRDGNSYQQIMKISNIQIGVHVPNTIFKML